MTLLSYALPPARLQSPRPPKCIRYLPAPYFRPPAGVVAAAAARHGGGGACMRQLLLNPRYPRRFPSPQLVSSLRLLHAMAAAVPRALAGGGAGSTAAERREATMLVGRGGDGWQPVQLPRLPPVSPPPLRAARPRRLRRLRPGCCIGHR